MKILGSRLLHLLLVVGILLSRAPAQVKTSASCSRTEGCSSGQGEDNGGSGAGDNGPSPTSGGFSDWQSFVIPGVADLTGLSGTGIIIGGGLSGGYGQVHTSDTGDSSGSITVAQPYVGIFQAGHRHKVLLEYSPTIELFDKNQWNGGVLQRGGIDGYDDLSKQWRLVFSGYTTDGMEYIRELGGLAIGEYPGFLTFSLPTENLFSASASTGFQWRRTPRRQLSINAGASYSSVRHGSHYDAGVVRAQMTDYFVRDSQWYAYAQGNRYSAQPGCTRVGAGAGFIWNAQGGTTLSLEGGPEFGSGTCTVRLTSSFSGTLEHRFATRTVVYFTATRDLLEPYLLQSKWTDIFTSKIWQRTSQNTSLAVGAGYMTSSELANQPTSRYRSFLLFSEFHWRWSDSLSLVSSYRYFKRDFNNLGLEGRDSWVFASIVWHPVVRGTRH